MTMNIKEARIAAGLSREEVCKRYGITPRALQSWELGDRTPMPWAEKLLVADIMRRKAEKDEKPSPQTQ